MNFYQNQTFTVITDDQQTLTYTIAKVCDDGRLLVRSSLLEMAYFISQKAFEDFLRVIGYKGESAKYRIYHCNYCYYIDREYDSLVAALADGKKGDFDFNIELDGMVCAKYRPLQMSGRLTYTEEYKQWYKDQQLTLAKVEGSYP